MELGWHDLVGGIGVAAIVIAYAALQLGRWRAEELRFSLLNALGAAAILVSLTVDFNLSAALIEGFWLVISLAGMVRSLRGRETP